MWGGSSKGVDATSIALLAAVNLVLGVHCVDTSTVQCGANVCASGYICLPNGQCASPDRVSACNGIGDGAACNFSGTAGVCDDGICYESDCQDGFRAIDEECDGADLGGATCQLLGYYSQPGLACSADCTFDDSQCVGICGDGIINGPEICDTVGPPGLSCLDIGFDYGAPSCVADLCAPGFDECRRIGSQTVDLSASAVHRLDRNHAYAGSAFLFYEFRDGFWNSYPSPGQGFFNIADVFAISPSDVWIGSLSSSFHFDGEALSEHPEVGLTSIYGIASDDVFGLSGGSVWHWDGNAWTEDAQAAALLTSSPTALAGGGGAAVAVVGQAGLVLEFDGSAWSTTPSPTTDDLTAVALTPQGDLFTSGPGAVVHVRRGDVWTPTSVPGAIAIHSIGSSALTKTYVGGSTADGGAIWRFDGSRWVLLDMELESRVPAISVTTDGRALAATVDQTGFVGDLHQLDGLAWADGVAPISNSQSHVFGFEGTDVLATNGGLLLRFDGESWATVTAVGGPIAALWAADPTAIFAATTTELYMTDGVTAAPIAACGGTAMFGFSANEVYVASASAAYWYDGVACNPLPIESLGSGVRHMSGAGDVVHLVGSDKILTLRRSERALGWRELLPSAPQVARAVFAAAEDHIVFVGDNASVMVWDGQAWAAQSLGGDSPLIDVHGRSASDLYAQGGGTFSTLFHFDGAVWSRVRVREGSPGPGGLFSGPGFTAISRTAAIDILVEAID